MEQAKTILNIINEYLPRFGEYSEQEWAFKPGVNKWSKKEILGHLVDSALNNLRRFIVTQYQQNDKIVYRQDEWVQYQDYQETSPQDIMLLWHTLNLQIARVIVNIPKDKLSYTCDTGKEAPELQTLQFLIDDYITHMNHHLSQITGTKQVL